VEISIEEIADPELESEESKRNSLSDNSIPAVSAPRVLPLPPVACDLVKKEEIIAKTKCEPRLS